MDEIEQRTNYIHDALKERLPDGWTLSRAAGTSVGDSRQCSAYYRWHRWNDGAEVLIEVQELFVEQSGTIDQLCDQLTDSVYTLLADPAAKYSTPHWRKSIAELAGVD